MLLLTEVGQEPTPCEPHTLDWAVVQRFGPQMEILEEKHFEKNEGIYVSSFVGEPFDHANPVRRVGILLAKLRRRTGATT